MLAFFWLFARYVERKTRSGLARDLLLVALGLGTMLYPYGGMFVGHALAAAAVFSAFILMDDPRVDQPAPQQEKQEARRIRLQVAAAGFLAALAVTLEYQAILVALALAVYLMVRNRRAILPFAVGALAPAIALGAYHTALFGRPWTLPYANIENPVFAQTAHKAGFDGLSLPHLEAFPAFLISPAYGLFTFSPVLILGLAGAIFLVARGPRREAVLTLVIAASMFIFIAGMSNWRAGWCVGPRYIATVAPFLLLPIVQLWPRLAKHACGHGGDRRARHPVGAAERGVGRPLPALSRTVRQPGLRSGVPAGRRRLHAVRARVVAGPAGDLGDGAARAGGAGRAGAGGRRGRSAPAPGRRPPGARAGDRRPVSPAALRLRPRAARRRDARDRDRSRDVGSPRGAPIPESRR